MERKEILERRTQAFNNINGLQRVHHIVDGYKIDPRKDMTTKSIKIAGQIKEEKNKYNFWNAILKIEGER